MVPTVRGMTTATVAVGSCRSQRLTLPSGERTWTVLGTDHRMVEPAEEYLEYLRAQQASPNTVKSYARALALWWQYLDAFDRRWDAVTLEEFGAFLTWLRTGDEPEVVSIERRPARFSESTIATRLAAVISCYDYHVLNGVDVGRDLHRITHRGGGRYKPLLEHIARRKGRRQTVIRVRQRHRSSPPPILTPPQIERICEACASWDTDTQQWRGSVRNRLLWMLLAETGMFSGDRPCGGGLTPRVCAAQRLMIRGYRAQQVWCKWVGGGSPVAVSGVEAGHQFAVGGAGGGEVLVAFGEFQAQVDGLLFEVGDLLVQGVDVGRGAQPGLAPGVLTECFGEALLEVLDASVQPGGAFVGGEQVGLQRGSGDRRAGVFAGGWFGGQGVDLLEQVAVAVEEAAVHRGGAGDRGHPDLGACSDGIVERGDNALAAAEGVGTAPVGHRLGPCARRRGGARRPHAVASEVVVVRGAGPAPRTVGMPRGTAWAAR